jgi:hypothetical protein
MQDIEIPKAAGPWHLVSKLGSELTGFDLFQEPSIRDRYHIDLIETPLLLGAEQAL